MVDNGYPWTFPGAVRAALSWHSRDENSAQVALVIQNRIGSEPLPAGPMTEPTLDLRLLTPESAELDNDSVSKWAESNLARYYTVKRQSLRKANDKLIAEWDLSPKR